MSARSLFHRNHLIIGIATISVLLSNPMDALAADVLCITPPPTAKDFAICRLEKLQRLRNDPVQLRKASAIAKRLIERGEAAMQAGRYSEAGLRFSTANAWLPSYTSMLGDGKAFFTAHASNSPSKPHNCSTYFSQGAKMELRQTYDAALEMHELADDQTGKMPAATQRAIQQQSACLHRLAERDSLISNSCTPHQEIRDCLNLK